MTEQQIRKIMQEEIQSYMTNKQYNLSKIPNHEHNGTDSNRISQKSIIPGSKYVSSLSVTGNTTINVGGVFNPNRIVFQGFAANNADGTPATKRAILNGEINFGQSIEFTDLEPPYVVTTSGPGSAFTQSANSMYVDSTSLTNNRVAFASGAGNSSTAYCIYAFDESGNVFATGQAISYNNQTGILQLTFEVGTNVQIQTSITIT